MTMTPHATARNAEPFVWPRQGEWTYEDWLCLPDDGWRYEVIRGVLYMSPAPTIGHQRGSRELFRLIDAHVTGLGGEVLYAPVDVFLPGEATPVEPDLIALAPGREDIVERNGIHGAPDLLVEILSPSTRWHDRRIKLPLFAEAGVRETWLVDPEAHTISIYSLPTEAEGDAQPERRHLESEVTPRYERAQVFGAGETARSVVFEGLGVAVDAVVGGG
jgi:Uma2 family endonuclease